jgi:hypothetical protein
MCIIAAPIVAGMSAEAAAAAGTAAMMANVSLAMGAVSAGVGAFGAIRSGEASAQANAYQAKVAQNNAVTATNNATYARQSGNVAEQQSDLRTAALIGNQRASEGSNGFDVNSGSNLDLQAGSAEVGAANAQTIRSNAAWTAYGYQTQSSNASAQAGLYGMGASNAMTAGMIGAGGSIIGGASALTGGAANFTLSGIGRATGGSLLNMSSPMTQAALRDASLPGMS